MAEYYTIQYHWRRDFSCDAKAYVVCETDRYRVHFILRCVQYNSPPVRFERNEIRYGLRVSQMGGFLSWEMWVPMVVVIVVILLRIMV